MNKEAIIIARNKLSGAIREFFASKDFLEVETPILVASPDLSPNLIPFETKLIDRDGKEFKAALITSPEFSMKKLLGKGLKKIFTLTKVFRNSDFYIENTSAHNPEFTMLEWYEQGLDYHAGMKQTEELVHHCQKVLSPDCNTKEFARIHLPTAFEKLTGLLLWQASKDDLVSACKKLNLNTHESDSWSDLFHRIVITNIEPGLPKEGAFLYEFPASEAALAQKTADGHYAQRFELYLEGQELCNAFQELTSPDEQRERFEAELKTRKNQGKSVFPIDEELLRLLPSLTNPTFGNALGVDRLLMTILKIGNINDVLPFSAQELFNKK